MSRGTSEGWAENSEGADCPGRCCAWPRGCFLQIVEAGTRVVKWSVVKRDPRVERPFEQDSSQQQISAEQVGRSARGVRYLQATAELDRQDQDRPSCTARAETSDQR